MKTIVKKLAKLFRIENLAHSLNEKIKSRKYYYGDTGEDVLLQQFCNLKNGYKGFYIDIGAYHPDIISNTKYFYEKGWRGINIDPNPVTMKIFKKKRPRDININIGVSDTNAELDFYFLGKYSTINTFDKTLYEEHKKRGEKAEIIKVKVMTINEVLERHLPQGQHIDFVNLDVENFEFRILNTFDFTKYGTDYFLIEDLGYWNKDRDFMEFQMSPLYALMKDKGYIVAAKTWYTILFKRKSSA